MSKFSAQIIKYFFFLIIIVFSATNLSAQQTPISWNEITHPPAYLNNLIASGSKLIAGTDAGIFTSIDNGQTWEVSNNGLPDSIKVRALARQNSNIFAATNKGIWVSSDVAKSWSDTSTGILQNRSINVLFISGTTIIVGDSTKLFRSINAGQNWTELPLPFSPTYITDIDAIADTFYVLMDSQLFSTLDSGLHWNKVNLPINSTEVYSLATSGSILFLSGKILNNNAFASRPTLWRSENKGQSWQEILSFTPNLFGGGFSNLVSLVNNVFIIGSTSGSPSFFSTYFFGSTNSGINFTIPEPPKIIGSPFAPVFRNIFLVNGRIYVTRTASDSSGDKNLYQSASLLPPTTTTVSAANYQISSLAGESVASVFGTSLALTTASAAGGTLPTSLENTSVTITDSAGNMKAAPLFYISPTQINFQLPAGLANGVGTIAINLYNQVVATGVVAIANTAPGIFSANQTGIGLAAANVQRVKADGTSSYEPIAQFNATTQQFVGLPINVNTGVDQPYLNLYGTGIRGRSDLANVKATIGGIEVPVTYAGAHGFFTGVDQVNILLPSSLAGKGEVDLILTVDNQVANTVKIIVQ